MVGKKHTAEEIVAKLRQVDVLLAQERQISRLRRAVSDLTLDKLILAEAAKGNF